MKFCPKCGSMIMPKKVNGKNVIECSCGYMESDVEDMKMSSASKASEVQEVEVMSSNDTKLPITKSKCEKCGNGEAYYWEQQTRASDEPPTRFYRCTACKYTWREYS